MAQKKQAQPDCAITDNLKTLIEQLESQLESAEASLEPSLQMTRVRLEAEFARVKASMEQAIADKKEEIGRLITLRDGVQAEKEA